MKRIFFILTLIISGSIFAQETETVEKTIGEFTELKVYDLIQLELVNSEENKIVITGKNTEQVTINNKNGKLKIKMNIEKLFNGNDTKVTLYYKHIDVIDVNEGAQITSDDVIKQFEIDLRAQEGATISVPVDVKHTLVKSVTGGIITVTGTSKDQNIDINTGGVFKGEALITEDTDVSIKAGGEAYVNATQEVNAKIRAGGDVYIYGRPEVINENTALGGSVKRMDK
ncbi:head GIN domain-containing protein [Tamlana sp. 2_MG-2023]|uniref:head GIN domain-containing protein n=1 Tax=unclassified Tamlana TaxID=2614803 RepID=UPI0026E4136C|nr:MULTISPECIES: head GIN domain-containing protein [unclassified Tamlana]MDO6759684.1 head GIN domain-containing protein [Tamlana sp. 2_MG-2023]MDO6791307.1 head GIN domain-containing protein [Tamlana sp. 1_MG-2023]